MQPLHGSAAAVQRCQARSLLVGLPARQQLLQRQQDNLQVFVQQFAADFAAMPFEPWTVRPLQPRASVKLEVRPSALIPGMLGVFVEKKLVVGYVATMSRSLLSLRCAAFSSSRP
jgi:hypothetical protein